MTRPNYLRPLALALLLAAVSMACSLFSIPSLPDFPTPVPPPADLGTPTGPSPLSGDWGAPTDFGKITFRIGPDGSTLDLLYVEMNNWTCGGVTLTTGIQTYTDPPTRVTDGAFSTYVNLSSSASEHYNEIEVSGQYDEAADKFTGEWVQDSISATCTGTWETPARP
ncbi:MAG: hypothetical protein HYZ25_15245 [Chloroflexi bacterium]|nr:hypothetical protein [Chloroflexota bacterium]